MRIYGSFGAVHHIRLNWTRLTNIFLQAAGATVTVLDPLYPPQRQQSRPSLAHS